jgi:hypothetical protein
MGKSVLDAQVQDRARFVVRFARVKLNLARSATQSAMQNSTAGLHHAVIRVFDKSGKVIETHEQTGEFRAP